MNAAAPTVDELSRPAKALIDAGVVAEFAEANAILAESVPAIVVGPDAISYGHQAALLTAVEVAARTFGKAPVHLPVEIVNTQCGLPGLTNLTVAEAVLEAGGILIDLADATNWSRPTVAIGATTTASDPTLHVTWDHWVASVNTTGDRLPERGNMVLAAVAAAALAVTECFKRALGSADACYRPRSLNLWRPDVSIGLGGIPTLSEETLGPDLRFLPSSVWMVGLGHLGQGFAWCWRLLPYLEPPKCEIHLQDFDKVNAANHTTGMLIRKHDIGQMKTRIVAAALERAGFATRIVERRLSPGTRRHETEPSLALVGVDKIQPRLQISDVGWALAVDVGLGAGPVDFTAISIHTFPAPTSSHDVRAWQVDGSDHRAARAHAQDAYRNALSAGADQCGLVQLAETAVAAPFVGVVAACLALAEPLRLLHGRNPNITLGYDAGRTVAAHSTLGTDTPRIAYLPARLYATT